MTLLPKKSLKALLLNRGKQLNSFLACSALTSLTTLGLGLWQSPAQAEGSYQMGLNQWLFEYDAANSFITAPSERPIYVNILNSGEVINVSLCGNDFIGNYYPPSVLTINR
ncbi:MAG: hypothetical protein F6K04_06360 [Leptolyngbya sp. SIO4C5]|nr:hypothetical protein [Leptolyngbya sp. SIO4C5]